MQNRPKPMGVITFTRINNNKVVIYAGNYDVRSDDLYVFDLDTKVYCLILYTCKVVKVKVASYRKH